MDHTSRPGASFERATALGVRTARLPLERFVRLRPHLAGDVTTLAVVQLLLLQREFGDWQEAVPRCPALRASAPPRARCRGDGVTRDRFAGWDGVRDRRLALSSCTCAHIPRTQAARQCASTWCGLRLTRT